MHRNQNSYKQMGIGLVLALCLWSSNAEAVSAGYLTRFEIVQELTFDEDVTASFGILTPPSDGGCTRYSIETGNTTTTSACTTATGTPNDGHYISGAQTGQWTLHGTPWAFMNVVFDLLICGGPPPLPVGIIATEQGSSTTERLDGLGNLTLFNTPSVEILATAVPDTYTCTAIHSVNYE